MIAKILVDNRGQAPLCPEWGLAVYIEHRGHKILLDTGASGNFAKNAELMGVRLEDVEFGALSHAHFDHSDGLDAFFEKNGIAKFYLQKAARENCYALEEGKSRYIGIRRGFLRRYRERIEYVSGLYALYPGAWLLGHSTKGLSAVGKRVNMYRRQGLFFRPDDFAHEQSLVLETDKGLAVFNSCCHAGADLVLREVQEVFAKKPIYFILGGFHLYETPEEDVRAFARRLKETGVARIVTGHCTGERALELLREELGDAVQAMESGLVIEI